MDNVYIAIRNYLMMPNTPKHLVLKIDNDDGMTAELVRLGFKKENEYWFIARADAEAALAERLGIMPRVDWNEHWRLERERPFGP